ncbi:hypothetical protein JAAARDRAFT_63846 [Jaapia argillacea MUCL 33604]|uniref:Uncharacterized protein n=1 Tax=Jaapia argillacea MUCL 33604 TaxID=933084 RepID=A0A067PDP3_9AGAM|nr:hypothetical protein JAAARDRAFT_63846 [Jaapia argillacea MUCL 33604]
MGERIPDFIQRSVDFDDNQSHKWQPTPNRPSLREADARWHTPMVFLGSFQLAYPSKSFTSPDMTITLTLNSPASTVPRTMAVSLIHQSRIQNLSLNTDTEDPDPPQKTGRSPSSRASGMIWSSIPRWGSNKRMIVWGYL